MVDEKSRSVVLADKHQYLLEGIRSLLQTVFETVVMVADRKSLFEAIEKVKPALAVVDMSLPPTGGASIAQEIKQDFPDLKLVILGIHNEPTVVDEIMSAGASAFVLKQSAAVDLFEAVQCVREGRTFVSRLADKQ